MSKKRDNAETIGLKLGAIDGRLDRAERLSYLEAENARLKRAVAVLTVDGLILKEMAAENSRGSARKYPFGR